MSFWIVAALLAALAVAVILAFARRGGSEAHGGDPALATHARQIDDIEVLTARGVLRPDEAEGARAEAGRRLLTAAGRPATPARPDTRWTRTGALLGVASVPLLALLAYLQMGDPGQDDRPYGERVAEWRRADPTTLGPSQLAAVLEQTTLERPTDWRGFVLLGQTRLASADAYGALRAFEQAARLAPAEASAWEGLGETFVALGQGQVTADAERAFRTALARDPRSVTALFELGRARAASGDRAGSLALWRAAAAGLPMQDPRRVAIEQQIAEAGNGVGPGGQSPTDAAVGGMVARLAQRLDAAPNDPDGWARLVRSYGVLGDRAAQARALARARALFAGRPADLRRIEQEAR